MKNRKIHIIGTVLVICLIICLGIIITKPSTNTSAESEVSEDITVADKDTEEDTTGVQAEEISEGILEGIVANNTEDATENQEEISLDNPEESSSESETVDVENFASEKSTEDTVEEVAEGVTEEVSENTAEASSEEAAEEGMDNQAELIEEDIMPVGEESVSEYTIPSTVEEYLTAINNGITEFCISSEQDFIDVQTLCGDSQVNGFQGIKLIITSPPSSGIWNIAGMADFTGIGTEENPFQGTITCNFKNGNGVQLEIDKPLIAYLGEGGTICQLDLVCAISSTSDSGLAAAIAGNINGAVTIDDIWIRGTIGDADTGTVGIIAGNIEANSTVTIKGVQVPNAQATTVSGEKVGGLAVFGENVGGIAGAAENNVTVSLDDNVVIKSYTFTTTKDANGNETTTATEADVTLSGSKAVGGFFGVATGNQTWDLTNCYVYTTTEDESGNETTTVAADKLFVTLSGTASGCYMGQFAGKFECDESNGTLTVTGGNMMIASMSNSNTNYGSAGGFVGYCGKGTKIVKPEGTFTIQGYIGAYYGHSAGVAAVMEEPCMELSDYTIDATISNYNTVGGLIGEMNGGKCIIRNLMVTSTSVISDKASNYSYCSGGVIGKVSNAGAVELQGSISVLMSPTYGNSTNYAGIYIGTIDRALVYLSEPEGMIAGEADENGDIQQTSQLIEKEGSTQNTQNEIYTYGGIYRNQDMGNGVLLIGDRTLANVGVINNTISMDSSTNEEGVAEDWYQLTSVADFECLAITLGSEGCYGKFAFGLSDDTDYSVLLSAGYEVTNSVDISYDKTGIVTLNRNDKATEAYAFLGKLKGTDDTIIIKQDISERQSNVGVFSTLSGETEFSNLTLSGTITNATGVGGIAYQSIGTKVTLTNITSEKEIVNCTGRMAGILGQEAYSNAHEFTVVADNIVLNSQINGGNNTNNYYSGFIDYMYMANVSITNVTLGGKMECTGTNSVSGGYLGGSWTHVRGSIKDVKVQEGATYVAYNLFGVLIRSLQTRNVEGGRLTLDSINLNGLTVDIKHTASCCSLLFQDARNVVVEIIDYDCSGCIVKNPGDCFDEVAGKTRNDDVSTFAYQTGIISLCSSDGKFPEYHYENVATYYDSTGAELSGEDRPNDNKYTMYFYDVFQYFEDNDGNIIEDNKIAMNDDGYYILDCPEKVLLWDALQLAPSTVRTTFGDYYAYTGASFNSTTLVATNKYIFRGTLDLSNTSFYPVANITSSGVFVGEDDARIIFAADKLGVDCETFGSQHYGMHAGLFFNKKNENLSLNVSNITLSGTIANVGADSGALIVGGNLSTTSKGLSNGGTFTNITLDDLWINGYDGTVGSKGATALLISKISQGSAVFDGITMVNYPKTSETKAAAALISVAGASDVTDLVILFQNMTIADDIDGNSKHNGDVLSHASFIYHYDYTDDATINKGSGIYFFSTEDCSNGNVTYGNELDEYTEFSDTAGLVLNTLGISATDYKPYVYEEADKDIVVNPKTGDILKGCGTYEDPYIIENERQFLTLYCYMNETEEAGSYKYQSFYESGDGWKIIIPGDDTTFCAQKHEVTWNSGTQSFTNVNDTGASDSTEEDSTTESDDGTEGDDDTESGDEVESDDSTESSDDTEAGADSTDTIEETESTEEPIAVSFKYNPDEFPTPEELSRAYFRLEGDIDLTSLKDATYKTIADEFAGFGTEDRPFVGVWFGKGSDGTIHTVTLPDYAMTYETFGFIRYAKGAVIKDLNIATAHKDEASVNPDVTTSISEAGGGVIGVILGGDNIIDNVTVDVDYVVYTGLTTGYCSATVGGYVGVVRKGGLILRNVDDGVTNFRLGCSQSGVTYLFLGGIAGKVEDGYVLYEGAGSTGTGNEDSSESTDVTVDYLWEGTGGNTLYPAISNYDILDGDVLKEEAEGITVALVPESDSVTDVNIYIPNAAALQVMSMALNSNALNVFYNKNVNISTFGYTIYSRCRKAEYSDIGCNAPTVDYIAAAKYDNVMGYIIDETTATTGDTAYAYPYLYDYMGITGDAYIDYWRLKTNQGAFTILNMSTINNQTTTIGDDSILYRPNWTLAEDSIYDMGQFGDSFRGIGAIYCVELTNSIPYAGTFKGNFDGGNSTVILDITRELYGDDNSNANLRRAGLFNYIQGNSGFSYTDSADFTDTEATTSTSYDCYTIKNLKLAGQINVDGTGVGTNTSTTSDVGGVVGYMQNANYIFENISLDETNPLTIGNRGNDSTNYVRYFGGIIGWSYNCNVLITNCTIGGTEDNNANFKGYFHGGGLVGIQSNGGVLKILPRNNDSESSTEDLPEISYLTIESIKNYAGGMVGYSYGSTLIAAGTKNETEEALINVSNNTVKGVRAGGLIGESGATVYMQWIHCEDSSVGYNSNTIYAGGLIGNANQKFIITNATCDDLKIGASENLGGVIGRCSTTAQSKLESVTVSDATMEESGSAVTTLYIGGVLGYGHINITLQDVNVAGTKDANGTYSFQIITQEKRRDAHLGGLFGDQHNSIRFGTCTVDTIKIVGDSTSGGNVYAGGAMGTVGYVLNMLGTLTVRNVYIDVNPQDKANLSTVDNSIRSAGGCFGQVTANATIRGNGTNDKYNYGMTATGNTIKGRYAGGLIGKTVNNVVKLCEIEVSDGIIVSDGCAGGVIGRTEFTQNVTNYHFAIKGEKATKETDSDKINVVSNLEITAPVAGGFIGYYYGQWGYLMLEDIFINDCSIISKAGDTTCWNAGGMIGTIEGAAFKNYTSYLPHSLWCSEVTLDNNLIACEVSDDTLTDTELNKFAVGGIVGKLENSASVNETEYYFDNILLKSSNVIGIRKTGTTDVKLVQRELAEDGTATFVLADVELPEMDADIKYDYEALDNLEQEYGYFAGNFIGTYASHATAGNTSNLSVYILASDDTDNTFDTPVMEYKNTPVVDVGRNYAVVDGVEIIDEDTYREFCHIVYGATTDLAEDADANLADMKAQIEAIESEYNEDDTLTDLLKEIRVSGEAIETFNTAYEEAYTVVKTETNPETGVETESREIIEHPILIYRVQDGILQDVMDDITDVMTNVAGAPSTDIGMISNSSTQLLAVTCEPMIYDSSTSTSTPDTEGTASLAVDITDDGAAVFTSAGYDSVVDGKMSYTLVTYTYGWCDGDDSEYHQKVFQIPVFIEEPILYSVHATLMEGKVTDVASVKDKGTAETEGDDNVIMANDSDYTMLLEYTYGQARGWMTEDVVVDKAIYLQGSGGVARSYAVGTRLVLIDVTDGNKAYYYTVEEEVDKIYFSDFKDNQGKNYINRPINDLPTETDEGEEYYTDLAGHELTNVGVERYLLTVLKDASDTEDVVFTLHNQIYSTDEDVMACFQPADEHEKESVWNVRSIPGLTVSLTGKGTDTDIAGSVKKSDGLNVNATFELTASSVYWSERASAGGILDSSNNGKYLEIAFYLRDASNRRVSLPEGTNFSYKLSDTSNSENKAVADNSMIYYYKGIRDTYEISNFEYLINNISKNTTVSVEFNLDFGGADMSNITEEYYTATIELLKTSNKDYPMGSDNSVDSYSETVNAEPANLFGFVIRADDLNDLGINTYPQAAAEDTIPCHVMFDFSELLAATGSNTEKNQTLATWANYEYEVTYQLYMKNENGGYERYQGDDIIVTATEGVEPESTVRNADGSLTVKYIFSESDIEAGNGSEPQEGLLSFPCLITQNTEALTENTDNLTNYKLVATLVIREQGTTGNASDETTDFLIYTVTKLKIDM